MPIQTPHYASDREELRKARDQPLPAVNHNTGTAGRSGEERSASSGEGDTSQPCRSGDSSTPEDRGRQSLRKDVLGGTANTAGADALAINVIYSLRMA